VLRDGFPSELSELFSNSTLRTGITDQEMIQVEGIITEVNAVGLLHLAIEHGTLGLIAKLVQFVQTRPQIVAQDPMLWNPLLLNAAGYLAAGYLAGQSQSSTPSASKSLYS
jgi:hypothetical protein